MINDKNPSSFSTEKFWFAVYTRPKAEKKVKERFDTAGLESFLPLQTTVKQWSDRKKKVQVPLINSYVFVFTSFKNIVTVYQIPGVVGILKYLGKYAIVKNTEIENLKILSNNAVPLSTYTNANQFTKGEKVTISSGPFKGLTAVYLKGSGKHKVIVEIETLGQFIEVTMPLFGIENI
jgi:transcription antitermination factor NusG